MACKRKKTDPENAKVKMADLCARSEQCEYDISRKLYNMGLTPGEREEIISYLKDHGFIDDTRFAKSYALDKCRFSCWGPYKIRQGLAAKRIYSSTADDAIAEIDDELWDETAVKVARTKSRTLDLCGAEARTERIKLYKFLLTKGFASDMASETTKKMIKEQKSGM